MISGKCRKWPVITIRAHHHPTRAARSTHPGGGGVATILKKSCQNRPYRPRISKYLWHFEKNLKKFKKKFKKNPKTFFDFSKWKAEKWKTFKGPFHIAKQLFYWNFSYRGIYYNRPDNISKVLKLVWNNIANPPPPPLKCGGGHDDSWKSCQNRPYIRQISKYLRNFKKIKKNQ